MDIGCFQYLYFGVEGWYIAHFLITSVITDIIGFLKVLQLSVVYNPQLTGLTQYTLGLQSRFTTANS